MRHQKVVWRHIKWIFICKNFWKTCNSLYPSTIDCIETLMHLTFFSVQSWPPKLFFCSLFSEHPAKYQSITKQKDFGTWPNRSNWLMALFLKHFWLNLLLKVLQTFVILEIFWLTCHLILATVIKSKCNSKECISTSK